MEVINQSIRTTRWKRNVNARRMLKQTSKCYDLSRISIFELKSDSYILERLVSDMAVMVETNKIDLKKQLSSLKEAICADCDKKHLEILMNFPSMVNALKARHAPKDHDHVLKFVRSQPLTYGERAMMRTHCRNIARRVGVLDLLIRDSLYTVVDASLHNFFSCLRTAQRDITAVAVLRVQAVFDTKSVQLSIIPSKKRILDEIYPQLLSTLELAYSVVSLLKLKEFENILTPIAADLKDFISENLYDRVYADRNNSIYKCIHNIVETISTDFDVSTATLNSYEFICKKFTYYKKLRASLTVASMKLLPSGNIHNHFELMVSDIKICEEIPSCIKAGIFSLEVVDVKSIYSTFLDETRHHLHTTLQEVYVKVGESLYSTLFSYKGSLDSDINTLDEFVDILIKYNEMNNVYPKLKKSYELILSLHRIISHFSIDLTPEMIELSDTASSVWQQYNKSCTLFTDNLDGSRKFFMRELSMRSQFLTPLLNEATQYLNLNILNFPETDEYEALAEINKAIKLMEKIFTSSEKLFSYQAIIGVSVFDQQTLLTINEEVNSINTIWKVVEETHAMQKSVLSTLVFELDTTEIKSKCKAFIQLIKGVTKDQVIPDVRKHIINTIVAIRGSLELYDCIQSDTLQPHHWSAIHDLIGVNIYQANLTVEDVINAGVHKDIEQLETVVQTSRIENNLEKQLLALRTRCNDLSFQILSDKSKVNVSISNFHLLIETIKDIATDVNVILKSKYVGNSINGHKLLLSKLVSWQSKLEDMKRLQSEFSKVRALFTSPRANRYFHKTLIYFKTIDDFWRNIYQSCKSSSTTDILEARDFDENVASVESNLVVINRRIDDFLDSKCDEWPKLYALDKKSLLDIFSLVDARIIYEKYKNMLLPFSSELLHTGLEWDKTTGVRSNEERLDFIGATNISSKEDLVLWCKGICESLTAKLISDCRDFIKGNSLISSDLRNPRCSDQSRCFALHAKFWSELSDFNPLKPDRKLILKLKMKISAALTSYSVVVSGFTIFESDFAYKRISGANILLVLMNQRDILTMFSGSSAFVYDSAIKLLWDEKESKGIIRQSFLKFDYGNTYQGFGHRMLMTPLTQSYPWYWNSVLKGTKGTSIDSHLKEYAHFTGQDMLLIDSTFLNNEETADRVFYSAFKSNIFLAINTSDFADKKFTSMISERLKSITSAVWNRNLNDEKEIILCGKTINIQSMKLKVCLLMNYSDNSLEDDWTTKVRELYRPIHASTVAPNVLFSIIMSAHCFADTTALAFRLETLVEYLTTLYKNLAKHAVVQAIVDTIRSMGATRSNIDKISNLPYELLQHFLPKVLSDVKYDTETLMSECCIFLNTPMIDEVPAEEGVQTDVKTATSLDTLKACLSIHNGVVVVGSSLTGKSKLIKDLFSLESKSREASYHLINLTEVLEYQTILSGNSKSIEFGIEDYLFKFVDTLLESELSPVAHIVHIDTSYLNYISIIIKWCALIFSAKRRDVYFLWETCDMKHFDPSVVADTSIVYLRQEEVDEMRIALTHAANSVALLSDVYGYLGVEVISDALEYASISLILPMISQLHITDFSCLSSHVGNTFKVACNLMLVSVHRLGYNAESFVKDFESCLIFSIIWVIGALFSSNSQFKSAFESVFQNLITNNKPQFPKIDHLFSSYLVNSNDGLDNNNEYCWVSEISDSGISTCVHDHIYSHFHSCDKLLIPTYMTGILSSVQSALIGSGGELVIHGGVASGKTSLMRQLMHFPDHTYRSISQLQCTNSVSMREGILASQRNIILKLYENDKPAYGSIFIEDVNFDLDSPAQLSGCADFLRFLFENKKIFNLHTERHESCDRVFTVMSSRQLPAYSASRLLRYPVSIQIETSSKSIMIGTLSTYFPNVSISTIESLELLFSEVLKVYCSDVLKITERVQPLIVLSRLQINVIKVLSLNNTMDLSAVFTRYLFDLGSQFTQTKVKDIGRNILRTRKAAFSDPNFPDSMFKVFSTNSADFDSLKSPERLSSPFLLTSDQFKDYIVANHSLKSLIPEYIDQSSSNFWLDFHRVLVNLIGCKDVHVFNCNKLFLSYDLSLLAAKYCEYKHEFLLLDNADSCLDEIIRKQTNAVINSVETPVVSMVWHYHLSIKPSIEEWYEIARTVKFQSEQFYGILHEKYGYDLREDRVGRDLLETFLEHQRIIFSFENADLCSSSIKVLSRLDYQIEIAVHNFSGNTSYDFDMESFRGQFIDANAALSIVNSTHLSCEKYFSDPTIVHQMILLDEYRHESLRLILEIFRTMQKNLESVRHAIAAEYCKYGTTIDSPSDTSKLIELALVDSIFLVMTVRYFHHLPDEIIKFELPRLRKNLSNLQLDTNPKFDAVCVIRAGFFPMTAYYENIFFAIAFALLSNKAVIFVDHSSLASIFLAEFLSLKVDSVYDQTLREVTEVFKDGNASTEVAQTAIRILLPTISLSAWITSEILSVFFLLHDFETSTEIGAIWSACLNNATYSSRSMVFMWKRHVRSHEKGALMLSAIASSAKEISIALFEVIKTNILSSFDAEVHDKNSCISLSVRQSLSYLKEVMPKDTYNLFAVNISLKLSAEAVIDPIVFILSLLSIMKSSNGRCGFNFGNRSQFQLTPDSHAALRLIEKELEDKEDENEVAQAIQSGEKNDAKKWLNMVNGSCNDIPFYIDYRAFTWIELFAIMFTLKPHAIETVIQSVAADKGIADSSIVLSDTFQEKFIAKLSSLILTYGTFKLGYTGNRRAIIVARFHLFVFHSMLSVFLNTPSTEDLIHDDCVYYALQYIDSIFEGESSLVNVRLLHIGDILYAYVTSNTHNQQLIITMYHQLFQSITFNKAGEITGSLIGTFDSTLEETMVYEDCCALAATALDSEDFLQEGFLLSVYDLNIYGRLVFQKMLQHLPTAENTNVIATNMDEVTAKIDEIVKALRLPDILAGKQAARRQSIKVLIENDDFEVEAVRKMRTYIEFELKLFRQVIADLVKYLLSLKGEIESSSESVLNACQSIQRGYIPLEAPKLFPIHSTLRIENKIDYHFIECKKRIDSYKTWIDRDRPSVLSLNHFENPTLLLTALQEDFATLHNISIEATCLEYSLLTKLTSTLIRSIKDTKEPNCLYFHSLHLVNGYFDENENIIKALPDYSNSIFSNQKLYLKVAVREKTKDEALPVIPCPIFAADIMPVEYSVLSQLTAPPAFEVHLAVDDVLKKRNGRFVAFFSLLGT